jgi:hypothetical protein
MANVSGTVCPKCGISNSVKAGFRNRQQYFKCRSCSCVYKITKDRRNGRKIIYNKKELKENIRKITRNSLYQEMPKKEVILTAFEEKNIPLSDSYVYRLIQEINKEIGKEQKISDKNSFIFQLIFPGLQIDNCGEVKELKESRLIYKKEIYAREGNDKTNLMLFRKISKSIGNTSNGEFSKYLLSRLFRVKTTSELISKNKSIRIAYKKYCLIYKGFLNNFILNSKKNIKKDTFSKKEYQEIKRIQLARGNFFDAFEKEMIRRIKKIKS